MEGQDKLRDGGTRAHANGENPTDLQGFLIYKGPSLVVQISLHYKDGH